MILVVCPSKERFYDFVKHLNPEKVSKLEHIAYVGNQKYKFIDLNLTSEYKLLRGTAIDDYICLDCKESDNEYLFNSIIKPMKMASKYHFITNHNECEKDEWFVIFSNFEDWSTGYATKKYPDFLLGSSSLIKVKRVW